MFPKTWIFVLLAAGLITLGIIFGPQQVIDTSVIVPAKVSEKGNEIIISGNIEKTVKDVPITIFVTNVRGELMTVAQIMPSEDGSFSYTVTKEGPLWEDIDKYSVKVQYHDPSAKRIKDASIMKFILLDFLPQAEAKCAYPYEEPCTAPPSFLGELDRDPLDIWNEHDLIIDGTVLWSMPHKTHPVTLQYDIKINEFFKPLDKSYEAINAIANNPGTYFEPGSNVLFYLDKIEGTYKVSIYSIPIEGFCNARDYIEISPILPNDPNRIVRGPPTLSFDYVDRCVPNYFTHDPDFWNLREYKPPLKQWNKHRLALDLQRCQDGFVAVQGSHSHNVISCVKPETKEKLVERGWAKTGLAEGFDQPKIGTINCSVIESGALLNSCDLHGKELAGKDLSFASLTHTDLKLMNLRDINLVKADLRSADLSGADLRGADLSLADLRSANLTGADLSEADLTGADLRQAMLNGAKFTKATMSAADLRFAEMSGANLNEAVLERATFANAVLINASLRDAFLNDAVLHNADLTNADLNDAILVRADLKEANLSKADLSDANLRDANLTDANLSGTHGRCLEHPICETLPLN